MSAAPQVTRTDFAPSANPVINRAGTANFGAPFFCTWNTANGQPSTVTISNAGPNTLTVSVSGAPANILNSKGAPLNGIYSIPPNCPTCQVNAAGDFQGQTVTIFNTSNPNTTCAVTAQTAG